MLHCRTSWGGGAGGAHAYPRLLPCAPQERGGFVWLFFGPKALPADERPPIPYIAELGEAAAGGLGAHLEGHLGPLALSWSLPTAAFLPACPQWHPHCFCPTQYLEPVPPGTCALALDPCASLTFVVQTTPSGRLCTRRWSSTAATLECLRMLSTWWEQPGAGLAHGAALGSMVSAVCMVAPRAFVRHSTMPELSQLEL